MTRKKIYVMRCGLEVLLQTVFFFSIMILAYFGPLNMPLQNVWKPMYIILVVVLTYLSRRKAKKFFLFVAVHGLLLAGAIVVGGTPGESFFMVLLTLIVLLFSFLQRNKPQEEYPERMHVALAATFCLEYFFAYEMGNQIIMQFSIWLAVIFVIGQVFYVNFSRLDEIYRDNQETCNFPARRLFSTDVAFMGVTGVLVFVGMMIFYNSPFGNIFVLLKNGFLRLLGLFLGWLFKDKGPGENSLESTILETLESATEESDEYIDDYNPGVLQDIMNAIVIVAGIVLLIILIVGVIKAIRKVFYYLGQIQGAEGDVIESLDEIEKVSPKTVLQREEEISDRDLNMRARKLYKKQLRTRRKEKSLPNPGEVPSEITRRFATEEEAQEITRIYEKARYSDEKISQEEVNFLKKH